MNKNSEEFEDCSPRADSLIHSLRAFGYGLGMAIADLIDNSIFAESQLITIDYDWNDADPWIRIMDDGSGMSEKELLNAMKFGSSSPLEVRDPKDLGRFGLGMKTASLSQCKQLTVATKTPGEDTTSVRYWDLDHVEDVKKWEIGKNPNLSIQKLIEPLSKVRNGTIVIWKNLDKYFDYNEETEDGNDIFNRKLLEASKYLEMVFHQLLENKDFNIKFGRKMCHPWDPFLQKNEYTETLYDEKYEDGKVSITPYILPHISKRTDNENESGSGPLGWNAQQGFYLYRNKRMIVSGGYLNLDLKPEEHYKLARIKLEITNDMDHDWEIDVCKADAIPPERLKNDLLRIAKAARSSASEIYRARTGVKKDRKKGPVEKVWEKRVRGEKIFYKINTQHPVLKELLGKISKEKKLIKTLFSILETTVPHHLIVLDGLENEDCFQDLDKNEEIPDKILIDTCILFYVTKRENRMSHEDAIEETLSNEPFVRHPMYRAKLDSMKEQFKEF
jgi:hypothetical protein